jgi:hypothetical protein
MKPSTCFVSFYSTLVAAALMITATVRGSFIEVEVSPQLLFEGAQAGIQPETQPLSMPIANGDEVTVLHLGMFDPADVGQTRVVTRETAMPGEWDAALLAMKGTPNEGFGRIWYWLGLYPAFSPTDFHHSDFTDGGQFRLFNLQRIEVTPSVYRVWHDNESTFHRAELQVNFVWLIPEPATWFLGLSTIFAAAPIRLRPPRCHSQR